MNNFYIYRWIRLDTNTPFYVGKGKGNRAGNKTGRNRYFSHILNISKCEVEIIIDNLTEEQAFAKEVEFIKLYKNLNYCEANLTNGGEGISGHKMSQDFKNKRSIDYLGSNNPNFNNGSKISGNKNPSKRLEVRKKLSISNSGCNNAMFGMSLGKNPNSKQVIDITTGFIWDSAKEASSIYSMNYGTLICMLCGQNKNKTNLRYLNEVSN